MADAKRRRTGAPPGGKLEVQTHPLGLRPGGVHDAGAAARRVAGLGALACLPDALILSLLGALPPRSLARFGGASRVAYCFAAAPELWRQCALLLARQRGGALTYAGRGWKVTVLEMMGVRAAAAAAGVPGLGRGLCSTALYQPWLCATVRIQRRWLEAETIRRACSSELGPAEFAARYEAGGGVPVLISGCGSPGLQRAGGEWLAALCDEGGGFEVGPVTMTMRDFLRYAATAVEESPLYLFDPRFVEKVRRPPPPPAGRRRRGRFRSRGWQPRTGRRGRSARTCLRCSARRGPTTDG